MPLITTTIICPNYEKKQPTNGKIPFYKKEKWVELPAKTIILSITQKNFVHRISDIKKDLPFGKVFKKYSYRLDNSTIAKRKLSIISPYNSFNLHKKSNSDSTFNSVSVKISTSILINDKTGKNVHWLNSRFHNC